MRTGRPAVPTILVVEDNAITRKMVRKTLEAEGYAVLEAPDGQTALSFLEKGHPDLVLQDFRLPDFDALDLLARIRSREGGDKIPVIAFSGYQSKLEEARAAAVGFDDFLLKPVEPSRLVLAVQAYLPGKGAGPAAPGEGRCVLLVDDDPVQLKLGGVILRGLGFRVETASSAEEALAKTRTVSVDAIVTDTMMPRIDGFRFCLLVRQDPRLRRIPVVMVSSVYLDEKDREFARKVGASAFVLRTPSFDEVIDALRASLEGEPPPAAGDLGPDLKEEYTHRVIQQLERQVAKNADLAQRVALQATALSILSAISDAMSRPDVEGTLQDVLSQCLDAAGISRGALYQLGSGGELLLSASTGYPAEEKPSLQSFFGHPDLARRLLEAGAPASIPSGTFAPEEEAALLARAEAKSALLIPLRSYGETMGIFFLASEVTNLTADYWVPFAHAMSVQIGQALALTRAFARVASSERRYRALVENANDGIFIATDRTVVVEANRQAERFFRAAASELIGASAADLVVPEQHPRLRALLADLGSRGSVRAPDLLMRRKDGSTFTADVSVSQVRLDDEPMHVIILRDVTDQKKMQAQLMVSDRMASVGALAAGVAHEINNPLAAALANLDFAVQDTEELVSEVGALPRITQLQESLSDARDSAERVRQIVKDLKIFSRAEEDRRGAVDTQRVLESTLRMAWNEVRHRARLVKVYGKVPPVDANESRLGQVFLNLVVNAAQAIAEGRAESNEIRVTTSTDSSGRVVVEIRDTGPGIPPETLKNLFTPFFTTKPAGVGTGLGLAICQRIVTGLGGEISVESQVGVGTAFKVVLPAARGEAEEGIAVPGPAPSARRGRVLLIDDEEIIGKVVRRILSGEHDVRILASAQEALDCITGGERFDVIICDMMMPEVTGMEFHEQLLQRVRDQAERIVFLTGGAFTVKAREFLDRVPNARLEKPFEVQNLRALVNERVR